MSVPHNKAIWAKIAAVALSVALIVGLGSALARGQSSTHSNLVQRFQLRGSVASRFLSSYASGELTQEREEATKWLATPVVSVQTFDELTQVLGFQGAVLLDGRGNLIAVYPSKPSLIGTNITGKYVHLRKAIRGQAAVSNVVPSAAESVPVTAFAVPFDTTSGRRIYSGALAVSTSTLGSYLKSLAPLPGTKIFLQDGNDRTIASNDGTRPNANLTRQLAPRLAPGGLPQSDGTYAIGGATQVFTTDPISGTPWVLVMSIPQSTLFGPINNASQWISWVSFGGFLLLSIIVLVVLVRLAKLRAQQMRYKDELISHVSHELRTPLAAIHQFTTIVLDGLAGDLGEDQHRYLSIVLRNTEHLSRMVKDLVDSVRDGSQLKISPESFEVEPLVSAVVSNFEEHSQKRAIGITVAIPSDLPFVWADPARVRQILANLVDNALKFTPEGGSVVVESGLEPATDSVWISVSDTGIGLPLGEADRVFERLYQARIGTEPKIGLGLGLHICKELVERQGGTIRAASNRSQGSRFTFTLPVVDKKYYADVIADDGAKLKA